MNEYMKRRLEHKQFGKPPRPPKQNKGIAKKSAKKIAEESAEREQRGDDDSFLVKWHKGRIKYGSPVCEETGMKVERRIFQYAIMSNCHILEKRNCPSVMYNPANCLILLPDLHHKWDNISWEEREKWGCWPIVQERLIMVYPSLDPSERRFFPESVLNYMKKNDVFPDDE